MLLAHGFVVIVGGLMLLVVIGLILSIVALAVRCLSWLFRAITGTGGGARQAAAVSSRRVICPEPRCGHANPAGARYCARCGRPFHHDEDLDAYG